MTYWDEEKQEEQDRSQDVLNHFAICVRRESRRAFRFVFRNDLSSNLSSDSAYRLFLLFSEGLTDVFGQSITSDKSFSVSVGDYAPFLTVMTRGDSEGVYDADQPASVYLSARNTKEVDFIT